MKRYLVVCLAVVLIGALDSETDARARGQGILGSAHDFTDDRSPGLDDDGAMIYVNEWAGGLSEGFQAPGTSRDGGWNYHGEVCRVCHVPHDKGGSAWYSWAGEDAGLLWNHSLSETDAYSMYASDSLASEIAGEVLGKAKLCLSCHDGNVAINAFDDQQGSGGFGNDGVAEADRIWIQDYASGFEIGPGPSVADDNFLMGNHPISVAYLAGGPDGTWPANPKIVNPAAGTVTNERSGLEMPIGGGLWDPTERHFGVQEVMTYAPTIDRVLEKGMVQCHSCHDVHDAPGVNAIGTRLNRAGQGMAANRGSDPSGLCLSCHAK